MTRSTETGGDPELSVTLVLYNSESAVSSAARSLAEPAAKGLIEVLAVDNASPDGSVAVLESELPEAQVIVAPRNLGFAGGCNLAWPQVRGRYWMLLNPDVEIPGGGLERLLRWMDRNPEVAAATPELIGADGEPQGFAYRFPSIGRVLLELSRLHRLLPPRVRGRVLMGPYWTGQDETAVDWVPGAAMIVRRGAVEEVGLLSEEFFMYGEDIEWCWRMRAAGWLVGVCGDVTFRHRGGASSSSTWHFDEVDERIVRGVLSAYRRFRTALWTRLYATLMALAYAVEGAHPRRPAAERRRNARIARVWLRVSKSLPKQ